MIFSGDALTLLCVLCARARTPFKKITKKQPRARRPRVLSCRSRIFQIYTTVFHRSFDGIEIAAYQIALRWPHLLFLVSLSCRRPIGFRRDNDSPIRFSLDATAEVATPGNPNSLKDRVVIFG